MIGYAEIGYRIQDTNWNIDYNGTVKIYASDGQTIDNPSNPNPVVTPGNTVPSTPTKKKTNWLWWLIGGAFILIIGGIILIFGNKKNND